MNWKAENFAVPDAMLAMLKPCLLVDRAIKARNGIVAA
jgi:hypothetical protein